MVSAGGQSTCEIREDTTLWCWGNAAYGQVGDGETRDRTNPQQVGTSGWADVSASGATTCGIRLDQTLWCWGMNHRGQLGIGGKTREPRPGPGRSRAAVHQGRDRLAEHLRDRRRHLAVVLGRQQPRPGGRRRTPRTRYVPTRVGTTTGWTSVSLGGYYACGTQADGTGSCWGQNSFGQLGTGSTANRSTPTTVVGGRLWQRIDAGWATTCGLTTAGEAFCWGLNDLGQVGSERSEHLDPA